MAIVEARNISKRFGNTQAVKDVSFDVFGGEVFGMLGPNGAGKTTAIRMILNIFKPDSGTISVLGGPMNEEKKAHIGYLPEERGLYRELPLRECLIYLAELKGRDKAQAAQSVDRYLEELDLAAHATKKVKDLSKGMQQKAQIIATLAHEPELLILDEPFSGLDPVNTRRIRAIINEQSRAGKAIIMSSHQMSQVEEVCDRILLVNRGETVLYGDLADIKRRYSANALLLQAAGDTSRLVGVPGVQSVQTNGDATTLTLHDDVDAELVLRQVAALPGLNLTSIEVAQPSLDDIFVSVVTGAGGTVPESHFAPVEEELE